MDTRNYRSRTYDLRIPNPAPYQLGQVPFMGVETRASENRSGVQLLYRCFYRGYRMGYNRCEMPVQRAVLVVPVVQVRL